MEDAGADEIEADAKEETSDAHRPPMDQKLQPLEGAGANESEPWSSRTKCVATAAEYAEGLLRRPEDEGGTAEVCLSAFVTGHLMEGDHMRKNVGCLSLNTGQDETNRA